MKNILLFSVFAASAQLIAAQSSPAPSTAPAPATAPAPDASSVDPASVVAPPSTDSSIGDFIFVLPDPKATTNALVKVGSKFRFQWKVSPDSLPDPANVTISLRRGLWPDVGPWVVLASQIPNKGYYDWTVPTNTDPDKYIAMIQTNRTSDYWIRDRTVARPLQIYYSNPFYDSASAPTSMLNPLALALGAIGGIVALLL